MKKLIGLAAIPAIALAASAFSFAPAAQAATTPGQTCKTVTTVTTHTHKVITWKRVRHHEVEVITIKTVKVITHKTVCTRAPKPTPWGVSVQGVSCWQETSTLFAPFGAVNVTGGPVNGTYTDIDLYVNGVYVGDVTGPTSLPPGRTLPGFGKDGSDEFYMPGDFLPNTTYTVAVDIRNGATVLATSAPYTLVVPGSDDASWSRCFES